MTTTPIARQRVDADRHVPGLARQWAWFFGLAVVGVGIAVGMPILVVALLVVMLLVAVFYLSPGDATTVLSLAVASMFIIPQRYVFKPLGAAGTPALLLGVAALLWWLVSRMNGTSLGAGYNPVRIGVGIVMFAMLVAYAAGFTRPLVPLEGRNADRTLITWFGYAGLLLLSTDGVTSLKRLDVLLRRMVWGGAYMSFVALTQFFSKNRLDLAKLVHPPGLAFNAPTALTAASTFTRGGFYRVAGTAEHPIEFSVVAAALLPLAVHYAFADTDRSVLARWAPVGLMGFAMPLSLSRSGFLGLGLAGICFLPAIPAARRLQLAAIGIVTVAMMTAVVHGLLGTVLSFVLKASKDNSITARTGRYTEINLYFTQRPIFGRGFGTFVPSLYDFMDNQYFLTVLEAGLVGLIAILLFFFSGLATARVIRKRCVDPRARSLSQALFAGVIVHVATFATYDALVFPTTGMTLFLTIGAVGALWRLTRQEQLLHLAPLGAFRPWTVAPRPTGRRRARSSTEPR
ncbi:MAG: hypothetical protein QOJ19_629 [Acidimicrobiia bacterium]|nr:hypothetical protein [Acidimicrobiia bacterium]